VCTAAGLPLGQLVLLQLVYEASAACTSIIVPQDPAKVSCPIAPHPRLDSTLIVHVRVCVCSRGQASAPQHIRTMDWGMEFLRPLTIEVDFVKGGRTQYLATTWVGYVGVLTGTSTLSLRLSRERP
jgi:hypothetical protein